MARLVVFEGIDGSGTTTQSCLLLDFLRKTGRPAERIHYPDYGHVLGDLILGFLNNKHDFFNSTQVLLYFADMVKDTGKIRAWLREGKTVILDRYITSIMAYQGLAGFDESKIPGLAEMFGLPKPGIVVLIDISPETSLERKFNQKLSLDRKEADKNLQKKIRLRYKSLAKRNVLCEWKVVNGEKNEDEVFEAVKKALAV